MSGKNRNATNTHRGKNGAPSTSSGVPSTNFPCQDIFKNIDLKSSESVQRWVPLIPGRGSARLIPRHICFGQSEPASCIEALQSFRRLGDYRQQMHIKKSKQYSKSERRQLEANEKHLLCLQQRFKHDKVTWKDIAGQERVIQEPSRRSKRLKTSTTVVDLSESWVEEFLKKQQVVSEDSSSGSELQVPDETSEDTSDETSDDDVDVAASSSEAKRKRKAEQVRKAASSTAAKPHYKGEAGTEIRHAADQKSTDAVHIAMRAAAIAADTVRVKGLQEGQPKRAFVGVDVNQVNEGQAQGGLLSLRNAQREKTRVTWVGPKSDRERMWILEQMIRSIKHVNDRNKTHQRVDLFPLSDDDTSLSIVLRYLEVRKENRSQPSTTPRSTAEVIQELIDELETAEQLIDLSRQVRSSGTSE